MDFTVVDAADNRHHFAAGATYRRWRGRIFVTLPDRRAVSFLHTPCRVVRGDATTGGPTAAV